MDRTVAEHKQSEWVESPSLRRHCETVAHVMHRAAERYGDFNEDPEPWYLAGLLHDADYEKFPQEHPRRIVAWLRENNEETIAHAIECHALFLNVPCVTAMDKAMVACDELTGFVVACTLMRPDGIVSLEAPSVMKKLKDKKFAAGCNRDDIKLGARLLNVELIDHVNFVIGALKEKAADFSLTGK